MSFGGLPEELIDPALIRRISPVAGGGIAEAYRVETTDGLVFANASATRRLGFSSVKPPG
ncbi:hypothetical protein [Ornithinimicrobium sp. INDO-MA30-4]|uniref:hypothetical protein n=1 Tax=Ornithinimicrobium sp. INDO-MA30-4 TaxID=2908651 RepID=UPI001F2BA3D8|nr:hypothetical protein [Ornithinimicrobium sp. INDO-MA30-4]UJH69487.1 hypothetical protein L0A91_08790 [Ornithinimicrobium sp. INDO-MA30-4]